MRRYDLWKRNLAVFIAFLACLATYRSAEAATACSSVALGSVFGEQTRIHHIPDWGAANLAAPMDGAQHVDADTNSFCVVTGDLSLSDAMGDRANFGALLPDAWNGKVLQVGCGGNCGTVFLGAAPLGWVRQGYAIWATDDGHEAGASPAPRLWSVSDARWAVDADGKPDALKTSAFLFRATHALADHAKAWTRAYYGADMKAAYFAGCSDGGREALVEAERYPDDFDGILAGDPYFDIEGEVLSALADVSAQMRRADAGLTDVQWHLADRILLTRCDAADGVRDGLIQNPAMCDFKAERDLPHCGAGEQANGACFTDGQIQALNVALSSLTSPSGKRLYPGFPASDLASGGPRVDNMRYWLGLGTVPGGWVDPASQPQAWYFGNQTLRYLGGVADANISFVHQDGGTHAVVPDDVYAMLRRAMRDGDGTVPAALDAFLSKGHKLILYHGLSDGDITPYRTLNFYRALADRHGGYARLARHVMLFAVPGMAHCGGGTGPTGFGQGGVEATSAQATGDIMAALDTWVQDGVQPHAIVATHAADEGGEPGPARTMPLCPFPAMARYSGDGDVRSARNWTCDTGDRRMLKSGAAGIRAGY